MKTVKSLLAGSSQNYRTVRFTVRPDGTVNVQAKSASGVGNREYGFAQSASIGSATRALFAAAANQGFGKKSLAKTEAKYTQALVRVRTGGGLKWQIPQNGENFSVPAGNRRKNYVSFVTSSSEFGGLQSFLNKATE